MIARLGSYYYGVTLNPPVCVVVEEPLVTAISHAPVAAPVRLNVHVRVCVGLVPAVEQLVPVMSACPDCFSFTVLPDKLLPVTLIVNDAVPVACVTGVAAAIIGQLELADTTKFTVIEPFGANAAGAYGELLTT
jgi:hypothetical protein